MISRKYCLSLSLVRNARNRSSGHTLVSVPAVWVVTTEAHVSEFDRENPAEQQGREDSQFPGSSLGPREPRIKGFSCVSHGAYERWSPRSRSHCLAAHMFPLFLPALLGLSPPRSPSLLLLAHKTAPSSEGNRVVHQRTLPSSSI